MSDELSEFSPEDAGKNIDIPDHLSYTADHVWVDDSVDPLVIGITEYATEQLGEIVFVEFPEVGSQVEAGDEIAQLESSKVVSPLVSPVSGTVKYVNREAYDDPSVIDNDPYGEGWLIKIEADDDAPDLLTAEEYAKVAHD
ncbi:glycine cleavage system protein GcvH [Bifidobacterium simiarum]|uniref:Glycine cleavage system H protein n=1 Tax=Bifidobacterium simiarum TaxID=2045441 RepID=A0A2M9HF58_9BIFI|nr:glycine cleavage system protein GcvH [Bifidobacterium simiarum]MBT1165504.1 glycine cleavage system protein GcvH [Bifidobacterium simiarum]PJM75450.1 glycine cleavage system protein H [Bifidobacterium simiarum]